MPLPMLPDPDWWDPETIFRTTDVYRMGGFRVTRAVEVEDEVPRPDRVAQLEDAAREVLASLDSPPAARERLREALDHLRGEKGPQRYFLDLNTLTGLVQIPLEARDLAEAFAEAQQLYDRSNSSSIAIASERDLEDLDLPGGHHHGG